MFPIITMVTWLVPDALPPADPAMGTVKASLLWPGVALAILAAIGLFGGFGL